jgi:ATP-dependent DNA ligase
MKPITYPARPTNGGGKPGSLPGNFIYETKDNGWRALVHIETGTMFNRKGELLSIADEFKPALELMRGTLDAEYFKWADCEALERRHGIGRGCLVVLDVVPEPAHADASYAERRRWLDAVLRPHDLAPFTPDGVPLLCLAPQIFPSDWDWLQAINQRLGCEFYEGMVAKRADSPYNIQLVSPDQTTSAWVKYRWDW